MTFLGLTASTQWDRLEPAPQGVAHLTNRENRGKQSDDPTNWTMGKGGRTESPTNVE